LHSLHAQLDAQPVTGRDNSAARPTPAKPLPTLLTVARLAGVSSSTVSRALRGHRLLNEETVARIRRVAASVGYHANPIISDLMRRVRSRGRLQNLGTVAYLTFHDTPTAWRENSTYVEFHDGARQRAQELGFALEPIWAREPHLHSRRLTQILKSRGITGVVVGPRPAPWATDLLDWSQFSVAAVGMPLGDLPLHRAGSYHGNNMDHVLAALKARGYERPGLALLDVEAASCERGWLAAWELHQHHMPAAQRVPLLVLDTLAPEPFARWFERHQPDIVIGLHDEFVTWMTQCGRRVPRFAGFARLSRPLEGAHPAGLHQFASAIGAAAVDLVADQVFSNERGIPGTPRALLIEGKWIDGWTARPAR
jgi:DNA-binding LacI/PurR family transcriptional regulator